MATNRQTEFGDLVRRARREAGLTQEALAELAGISARAVSDLERGVNRAPRRDTLDMLTRALELTDDERSEWETARRRLSLRLGTARNPEPDQAMLHVPAPPTSFVGRDREIERVVELLRLPETRLLTLTGPGGVGKTRLAVEAARRVAGDHPDGVWFVDLSPLNDHELVLPTLAVTLDVPLTANQPALAVLTDALAQTRTLLLLDNLEHLLEAAPQIGQLLSGCPQLMILATSRAPLQVQAEQEYLLPPLDLPEFEEASGLKELQRSEAVRLFAQRAQAVRPDFELTDDNVRQIAAICQRLDGIPLAIELAAARIRLLSPQVMLRRLERSLTLLTGGALDLPPRQQTLRSTIGWSYDLLPPESRRLFQYLSVFRGGWTLESAEAVTGDQDVIDHLERLVQHSLVRVREQPDGEPRYSMLETIREFGLERLADSGNEQHACSHHAGYFLNLAERAMPMWRTPADREWSGRLRDDLDNLRATLSWSVDNDVELFCQLSGALWRFFALYGQPTEGRSWLEMARSRSQASPPAIRARVLEGTGVFAYLMSDYDTARDCCEQALSIWQALDNLPGEGWMLHTLGRVAYDTGDYALAERYYSESLEVYEQSGDIVGMADTLNVLGIVASTVHGDLDRARSLYEKSLDLRRKVGDRFGIYQSTSNLGVTAQKAGDYSRAKELIEESQALALDYRLTDVSEMELLNLGTVALREGDEERALSLLTESLQGHYHRKHHMWVIKSLMPLVELAIGRQHHARAVAIAGAIDAISAEMAIQVGPADRIHYDRAVAEAQTMLTPEAWDAAWSRGRTLSLAEAVDFALYDDGYPPD